MKELSIEEKAQRYDKAIERAKKFYILCKKCGAKDTIDFLEDSFPELKENEDEKIRKRIIHALHGDVLDMEETTKAIAWLEKQDEQIDFANKEYWRGYHEGKLEILDKYADLEKKGEQKLADKYNIRGIKSKHAEGKLGEMIKEMKSANKIEPKFNVDDIISNGISEVKIVSIESNYYNVTNYEIENDAHICNWVVYFKDQDNWKLKDRVQPQSKKGEQKVADKKESLTDVEKSILNFADYFHSNRCKPESEWVDETKMLRDYIPSCILKPATWSEDDSYMLGQAIKCVNNSGKLDVSTEEIEDWLKSLKDHVQPKQDWFEKDEKTIDSILSCIEHCRTEDIEAQYNGNHYVDPKRYEPMSNWLKSLRFQKKWKPSEELITYLYEAIDIIEEQEKYSIVTALRELLEQLKQL